MRNLYVTSDKIGDGDTGPGKVTNNELEALQSFGETDIINPPVSTNPFEADEWALNEYRKSKQHYDLAHFYAGTYTQTVAALKADGTKVTYTCAAHDVEISRYEREAFGLPFELPHLTVPELWKKYSEGYLLADVIICPGKLPAAVVDAYDPARPKKIEVILHGIHLPTEPIKPISDKYFVLGYLGACGTDKGLRYLIDAWAKLNYKDALLVFAGMHTPNLWDYIRPCGDGATHMMGWIEKPSLLYNYCSVYCQPSATEGFGIEVPEAMSFGRPVICSTGAGAADCVTHGVDGQVVERRNVNALAEAIDYYKQNPDVVKQHGAKAQENAKQFTWGKIQRQYRSVWHKLLKKDTDLLGVHIVPDRMNLKVVGQ